MYFHFICLKMDQSELDQLMQKPDRLLSVRVECGTMRDLLSEMNNKIEELARRISDFVQNKDYDHLVVQIEQLRSQIENGNIPNPEAPVDIQPMDLDSIIETVERKIEQSRVETEKKLISHSDLINNKIENEIRELRNKMNENINKTNEKFTPINDHEDLKKRVADIEMSILNNNNEKDVKNENSGKSERKRLSSSEKLSARTLSQVSGRGNDLTVKIALLSNNFDSIQNELDKLKHKIAELENENQQIMTSVERFNEISTPDENVKNRELDTSSMQKQYTEPETIIKTVSEVVDTDKMKNDVTKLVLDTVLPILKEKLDKIPDNISAINMKDDKNKESSKNKGNDFPVINLQHSSPRINKSDPRFTSLEMKTKALKDRLDDLEKESKGKFNDIDNQMYDVLFRTSKLEKLVIEFQNRQNSSQESGESDAILSTQPMISIACQTVDSELNNLNIAEPTLPHLEKQSSIPKLAEDPIIDDETNQHHKKATILNNNETSPDQKDIQSGRSHGFLSGRAHDSSHTPRGNLSSRSHFPSQTYEEIDALTKQLEAQVNELILQMEDARERLSDKDRQIHQMEKDLKAHATKDDLDELRAEIEERDSFNRKNNPNSEPVTASQLKRVVSNFQNSMKNLDKQFEAFKTIIPNFVSKDQLTQLVEALSQISGTQAGDSPTSTAGARLSYKCLLCGRPTNQVTGMITESEVAKMIGEPPIIGASTSRKPGNEGEFVLVYGKEGNSYRGVSTSHSNRKRTPFLPKITPKSQ